MKSVHASLKLAVACATKCAQPQRNSGGDLPTSGHTWGTGRTRKQQSTDATCAGRGSWQQYSKHAQIQHAQRYTYREAVQAFPHGAQHERCTCGMLAATHDAKSFACVPMQVCTTLCKFAQICMRAQYMAEQWGWWWVLFARVSAAGSAGGASTDCAEMRGAPTIGRPAQSCFEFSQACLFPKWGKRSFDQLGRLRNLS